MKPMQGGEPDAVAQEQAGGERADETEAAEQAAGERESEPEGEAVYYSCPSCGAEIVTDATTAATFCYYCHNPVVLGKRLEGTYLPNKIIPFEISRGGSREEVPGFCRQEEICAESIF